MVRAGWVVGLAVMLGACVSEYTVIEDEAAEPWDGSDPQTGGDESDDESGDESADSDDGGGGNGDGGNGGGADDDGGNGDGGSDDGGSDDGANDDGANDDGANDDGGTTGGVPGGDDGGGDASVFQQDIVPILQAQCGCHLGGAPSAGLDLSATAAYDQLVGAPSSSALPMVTPGSADDSYLVHKMQGTQSGIAGGGGNPMPPGGSGIPAADLQVVIDWINDGAL